MTSIYKQVFEKVDHWAKSSRIHRNIILECNMEILKSYENMLVGNASHKSTLQSYKKSLDFNI